MKKIYLSTILALACSLVEVSASITTPATVAPQWTCVLTNPIQFSNGVSTRSWSQSGLQYVVDSQGDAGVVIQENGSSSGAEIFSDILYISAKGKLLGVIQCANIFAAIVAVTPNSIYVLGKTGTPLRYSLVKGQLVSTPFPTGDYGSAYSTLLQSSPPLSAAPSSSSGILGVTETDNSGNPTAISFFRY